MKWLALLPVSKDTLYQVSDKYNVLQPSTREFEFWPCRVFVVVVAHIAQNGPNTWSVQSQSLLNDFRSPAGIEIGILCQKGILLSDYV